MSKVTRRLFLQRASLGLAAVGGALALQHSADAASQQDTAYSAASQPRILSAQSPVATSEPLVAYVRNASAGEVSLFIGTREVRFHDADLVQRLIQAGA